MTSNRRFAQLVTLACHDLRTPLATVHGFTQTLMRLEGVEAPIPRYLEMMDAAAVQLGEILDDLALAARVESGRYEAVPLQTDTLELARAAGARLGDEASVGGEGGRVSVDRDPVERALYNLARCALRHGGLKKIGLRAGDEGVAIAPVTPAAAPIVLGDDLRDLGAAMAVRVLPALGCSVALTGETLEVRLAG